MAYHPAFLCLLVALPAAALAVRLAWPENAQRGWPELARLVAAPVISAVGAALLALSAAALLSPRAEPLPLSQLVGEWEVYNDSDHLLVGLWCFERAEKNDLTLRLIIYGFQDPISDSQAREERGQGEARHEVEPVEVHDADEPPAKARTFLTCAGPRPEVGTSPKPGYGRPAIFPIEKPWPIEIGPFPVRRSPLSGLLSFEYSSIFGCGRARLSPAWGFFGSTTAKPSDEVVALREGEAAYRRERRSLRWVRNRVVLAGWAAVAVAAAAGGAARRRKLSRGGSAAAAFVVTFVAVSALTAIGRPPHLFDPADAHGSWLLEVVSDRSKAGRFEWLRPGDEGCAADGPCFEGQIRSRAGNGPRRLFTPEPVVVADGGRRIDFAYVVGEGEALETGRASLRSVPTMTGPFHDHRLDPDCPGGNEENLNYGDFVAFKRPEPR